ncbi:KRAB-A domain-containing protein 2 [Parasteatoda tepidariorum]|uniref:KRAB-A domain-containing protein 2 n=1 Tax=Parasteatoda tepidariorum TaxID=114398 RepID=UPI00077F9EEB|nr:KRAB-A domain-containing protein 2 [Parasteatoda tepidariorum]
MDAHVPVDEFNAALWKRFQDGKIRNVYPLSKYKDIIEKIKSMNENPPCNIPGEYYLLRKFVVLNIAGKERLSCKQENTAITENSQDVIKFYVALEEIYSYIEVAHKFVKHGCRDRIVRRIQNQGIVNITRDTVELFLSYCKLCRPRKRDVFRKLAPKITAVDHHYERSCDSPLSNTSNSSDNHREIDEQLPVITAPDNIINSYVTETNSNNTVCTFRRGFIDLIDFSTCPDGDYRFVFLYIDLQTCFCVLYPTRCKCKYEIVSHLMSTFTLIGPPQILHSNFDNQFLSLIIHELKQSWTDIVMVSGSNVYEELQEVAQNCIADINSMLKQWMQENNSSNWSFGLKLVQLKKNTKLSNNGTKCPYECFFSRSINSSNIPSSIQLEKLTNIEKEDDLLALINEQNYSVLPYEHLQVSLDPNVCKLVHLQQNDPTLSIEAENVNSTVVKKEPLSDSETSQNGLQFSDSSNDCSSIQNGNLEVTLKQEEDS